MNTAGDRFRAAIERFDADNARGPHQEIADDVNQPKELVYARRMTRRLAALAPDASEALQLAARAQHLRRWEIPRADYPMDRHGYHRWRADLVRFHAEAAGRILAEVGYGPELIARVQSLVRKERLTSDPEAQLLEDVACLVFLEFYFARFAEEHDEQKVIGILQRTWKKMSARGHEAAMAIALPPEGRTLLEKALSHG